MSDKPLDMADLIRLAGDGMSWEDTMRHIDEVLAGGEDMAEYRRPWDGNRTVSMDELRGEHAAFAEGWPAEDGEPPHFHDWLNMELQDPGNLTEHRLARLDTADIIRLAGDGMSWEDTMAHIDRVLSKGESHPDGPHPGGEGWTCPHCGNTADADGFFPSTPQGVEMEPTLESDWAGHYVCGQCGDVRHQP